jgi:hypothetical protein
VAVRPLFIRRRTLRISRTLLSHHAASRVVCQVSWTSAATQSRASTAGRVGSGVRTTCVCSAHAHQGARRLLLRVPDARGLRLRHSRYIEPEVLTVASTPANRQRVCDLANTRVDWSTSQSMTMTVVRDSAPARFPLDNLERRSWWRTGNAAHKLLAQFFKTKRAFSQDDVYFSVRPQPGGPNALGRRATCTGGKRNPVIRPPLQLVIRRRSDR